MARPVDLGTDVRLRVARALTLCGALGLEGVYVVCNDSDVGSSAVLNIGPNLPSLDLCGELDRGEHRLLVADTAKPIRKRLVRLKPIEVLEDTDFSIQDVSEVDRVGAGTPDPTNHPLFCDRSTSSTDISSDESPDMAGPTAGIEPGCSRTLLSRELKELCGGMGYATLNGDASEDATDEPSSANEDVSQDLLRPEGNRAADNPATSQKPQYIPIKLSPSIRPCPAREYNGRRRRSERRNAAGGESSPGPQDL